MKIATKNTNTNTDNPLINSILAGVQAARRKKELPTLRRAQFAEWIKNAKGAIMLGCEALSDANARKTNNPHWPIFKRSRFVAIVGADYTKAVNREMERQGVEGEFKSEKLPWGEWLEGACNRLLSHKGELYLRTQSAPGQRKKSKAEILDYRDAAGKILSREEVIPFLPVKSISAKQSAAGLSEDIQIRTFKLSSLRRVRIAGITYKLID